MKQLLLLFVCLATFFSCNSQNNTNSKNTVADSAVDTNSYSVASQDADYGEKETLNDIRFDGWTKKEWADNEYIRAVRKYIDAYNSGNIEDDNLDEHKKYIQGKFVIADIQPYLTGGVLIYIIFYDYPEKTFSAHVYSNVDEKTRVVSNYECRGLKYENLDLGFSQEDILQFLKECPEHRLW